MGKSQELYKYAKTIIPGGTQLLSKRPEQFLPDLWPAYYSRAKGCDVWDLDNNHYTDFSYMGIGACSLGYACDAVDNAVKTVISNGSMCTLNAAEEVFLAEKLLGLHPWAEMVRYAKAGGEGMALAVRIARAATGRDKVMICGYHGWHDWYLSANIADSDSLSAHLLAGLDPAGVPKGLYGTTLPFHYNDIEEFDSVFGRNADDLAAVIMEPVRNDMPAEGYLGHIRERTASNGVVLLFDEITAGFRLSCGGSHMALGIDPDMAVFAKSMSNGYPVSAVIGAGDIMKAAQDTFMSSTFWTERTGFAAAMATIDFFRKNDVEKHLTAAGERVVEVWKAAAKNHGLEIRTGGIAPLSHFSFAHGDPLVCKTFFTQEMLKRGYLATTAFYASFAHTAGMIDHYGEAVDAVFGSMAREPDLASCLEGPVCQSGFQRLN
jgi:glutamate-1-semialdehyde aminotransferase